MSQSTQFLSGIGDYVMGGDH